MNVSDLLVAGSKYRVCAFQKLDGKQLWETELQTGFFKSGGPFVTLAVDSTGVYAHAGSEFFRLDLLTGQILWRVKVASMGNEVSSLTLLNGSNASTAAQLARIELKRKQDSSSSASIAASSDSSGGV